MKVLNIYLCLTLLALMPIGLNAQDDHDHDHVGNMEKGEGTKHNDHDENEVEFVDMTAGQLNEFGVELATASSGAIRTEIVVPGEIAVNGNRIAHIMPRFKGMITEVRANIGDRVRQGDLLAVVESNESLTPYEVKSLMDGTVIDKHAAIGEVLTEETAAFLIADLDTVWVNLSIYQMHLPLVRLGQLVNIALGHGQVSQVGTISYISPLVDEHTRTATARIVLDNKSGDWRPGLLVEGLITTGTYEASIVIPKTALLRVDETDVVFVKTEEGFFPQTVILGQANHTSVEVVRGLEQGQVYVSKGGFTLKAETQKGSFGEGHEH